MELTVQIGFSQLIDAIRKLPPEQKKSIQTVLETDTFAPKSEANREREFGRLKGLITYIAEDFDAPLDDFREYM